MSNLWSKENRKGPPLYEDLFDDISSEYKKSFKEWDQELKNPSEWKHKFLNHQIEAVKSESVANMFDNHGNVYFQRKEYHKAMEMYNQGLCFAPFNSSKMGTMYAKRGFCFFHMQMYAECKEDMELALSTDFPSDGKSQVNEYKVNCDKFLGSETAAQRKSIAPQLSFDANTSLPCTANVIEIHKNTGIQDSYVTAKSDIRIGQTVLVEEAFTSIAVGYDTAFCLTCLKVCKNLIPCTVCTDVMFCSWQCQARNEIHETYSCGEPYQRMPSYIKLVVQSILEAITAFTSVDDLMKFVKATVSGKDIEMETNPRIDNYALFFGLKSSSKPLPLQLVYEAYTTLLSMSVIGANFSSPSKQRFLMHLVAHHIQILLCNSYDGFDPNQSRFIVATMTNVASLFPHSCTPNLMQYTVGNQTVFVTNQPVNEGDRLYINYCPEELNSERRKYMLRNYFGVNCTCVKCNPLQPAIDSELWQDDSFAFIIKYRKYIGTATPALLKQKCVKFLEQYQQCLWTKEKEAVINTFTRCVMAEFGIDYTILTDYDQAL